MTTTLTGEGEKRSVLPEWVECQSMFADGTATPLTEFIRAYEPVQSTRSDDKSADEWREALAGVVNDAATQMRNKCVDRVREYLRHAKGIDIAPLINDLKSLSLDNVEQKQ